MIGLALGFFDKLLDKLFLDAAAHKITNLLDKRNVRRQMERAAELAGLTLDGYFRNEKLEEGQITSIIRSVEDAIANAGVTASTLASASLNAEKLTEALLDTSPLPYSLYNKKVSIGPTV